MAPRLLGPDARALVRAAAAHRTRAARRGLRASSRCSGSVRICGCGCVPQPRPAARSDVFTGIVQDVGRVDARARAAAGTLRLAIACSALDLGGTRTSATASACRAAASRLPSRRAQPSSRDVSRETLALTTLGELRARHAGESRAGAARRRCPRRPPGRRATSTAWREVLGLQRGCALDASCSLRACRGAGALHRAQGLGRGRWGEPHRQCGRGWPVRRQPDPAYPDGDYARRPGSGRARQPRGRPGRALRCPATGRAGS